MDFDRDYIIRVILEGRDMLSDKVRAATESFTGDTDRMRGSISGLTSEQEKNRIAQDRMAASWSRSSATANQVADRLEKLKVKFREMNESQTTHIRQNTEIDRGWSRLRATGNSLLGVLRQHNIGLDDINRTARRAVEGLFSFNRMIALLLGAIIVLVPIVIQLVGALTALASAAALAGAALGGALLAGIAQLVPAAGLLVATFHGLIGAVTKTEAAQKAATATHAKAAKQYTDTAEAANKLKEAELGVLEARTRLIELGIRNRPEDASDVFEARARQLENARAKLALADAQAGVRRARYDVAHPGGAGAGTDTQTQAQKDAANLDAAQKRFAASFERLKAAWKAATQGITDNITNAFTRALDRFSALFGDPGMIAAFTELGKAIASVVDAFSSFLTSPGQRQFMEFFTGQAAQNLPKIEKILENLIVLFEKGAQAASPLFARILDRLVEWSTAKADGTSVDKLTKFFDNTEKYLMGTVRLVGAFGNLLGSIISAAAGPGLVGMKGITDQFNAWATWIDQHPKRVKAFFDEAFTAAGKIWRVLTNIVVALYNVGNSPAFKAFIDAVEKHLGPALEDAFTMLGLILDAVGLIVKPIQLFVDALGKLFGFDTGNIMEWIGGMVILSKIIPGLGALLAGAFRDAVVLASLAVKTLLTRLGLLGSAEVVEAAAGASTAVKGIGTAAETAAGTRVIGGAGVLGLYAVLGALAAMAAITIDIKVRTFLEDHVHGWVGSVLNGLWDYGISPMAFWHRDKKAFEFVWNWAFGGGGGSAPVQNDPSGFKPGTQKGSGKPDDKRSPFTGTSTTPGKGGGAAPGIPSGGGGSNVTNIALAASTAPGHTSASFHLPGEVYRAGNYDCSAFVAAVFNRAGISLPGGLGGTTYTQFAGGRKVDRNDLLPGDLIFETWGNERHPGHVGIYVGGGQMVHDHGGKGPSNSGVDRRNVAWSNYDGARCYIAAHKHNPIGGPPRGGGAPPGQQTSTGAGGGGATGGGSGGAGGTIPQQSKVATAAEKALNAVFAYLGKLDVKFDKLDAAIKAKITGRDRATQGAQYGIDPKTGLATRVLQGIPLLERELSDLSKDREDLLGERGSLVKAISEIRKRMRNATKKQRELYIAELKKLQARLDDVDDALLANLEQQVNIQEEIADILKQQEEDRQRAAEEAQQKLQDAFDAQVDAITSGVSLGQTILDLYTGFQELNEDGVQSYEQIMDKLTKQRDLLKQGISQLSGMLGASGLGPIGGLLGSLGIGIGGGSGGGLLGSMMGFLGALAGTGGGLFGGGNGAGGGSGGSGGLQYNSGGKEALSRAGYTDEQILGAVGAAGWHGYTREGKMEAPQVMRNGQRYNYLGQEDSNGEYLYIKVGGGAANYASSTELIYVGPPGGGSSGGSGGGTGGGGTTTTTTTSGTWKRAQVGMRVGRRQGGQLILAGEAGFPEYVLTTDPRHRNKTASLLRSFLSETVKLGGKPVAMAYGGRVNPKALNMFGGMGDMIRGISSVGAAGIAGFNKLPEMLKGRATGVVDSLLNKSEAVMEPIKMATGGIIRAASGLSLPYDEFGLEANAPFKIKVGDVYTPPKTTTTTTTTTGGGNNGGGTNQSNAFNAILSLLQSLLGVEQQIKHAVILAADSIDADAGSKIRLEQANKRLADLRLDTEGAKTAMQNVVAILKQQLSGLQGLLDKAMPESDRRELLTRIAGIQSDIIENNKLLDALVNPVDNNIQGMLALRYGFWTQLASNIFSPGPVEDGQRKLSMGSSRPDQVTVNQFFTQSPSDPFVWFRKSAFAARSAFNG